MSADNCEWEPVGATPDVADSVFVLTPEMVTAEMWRKWWCVPDGRIFDDNYPSPGRDLSMVHESCAAWS